MQKKQEIKAIGVWFRRDDRTCPTIQKCLQKLRCRALSEDHDRAVQINVLLKPRGWQGPIIQIDRMSRIGKIAKPHPRFGAMR